MSSLMINKNKYVNNTQWVKRRRNNNAFVSVLGAYFAETLIQWLLVLSCFKYPIFYYSIVKTETSFPGLLAFLIWGPTSKRQEALGTKLVKKPIDLLWFK